jgi:hypothetical protein
MIGSTKTMVHQSKEGFENDYIFAPSAQFSKARILACS